MLGANASAGGSAPGVYRLEEETDDDYWEVEALYDLCFAPGRTALSSYRLRDGVDPVDWIEAIPFRETQTYVMRVAESLPIYRARLSGKAGPIRFTDELKGR